MHFSNAGEIVLVQILCWIVVCLVGGLALSEATLEVDVLDVGQGDAILITTPDKKFILIDGGPDQNILAPLAEHLPYLKPALDLIILTHPHADHLDGLLAVLQRYQVRGLLLTNVMYKSSNYQRLVALAREQGIAIFEAEAGSDWQIASNIYLDILFPFKSVAAKEFKNVNNASLVFKLVTSKETILFTGDMEKELEKVLLYYYQYNLAATYLKVGHHGSATSSTAAFLQVVKPKEMWVSVGENNRYQHPSSITMARLEHYGNVIRTDKVGTITKFLLQ